jgi:hypothetical protein
MCDIVDHLVKVSGLEENSSCETHVMEDGLVYNIHRKYCCIFLSVVLLNYV